MQLRVIFLLVLGILFLSSSTLAAQLSALLPVFPGAEGFGTKTPGGRGGKIIKVTNLNDNGPGSLRAAMETSGARIVVFEVGGVINLLSNITISSPYITVYGQSAPNPGIVLKNAGIRIFTHDVLIQHLAIRPGSQADAYDDCISIEGRGASSFYNIVLDHLSLTWAQDEQFVVYSGAHDITLTNSILAAEGMGEKHGALIGDTAPNITVSRNLFIHNHNRNPTLKGGAKAVIINNLIYNFGGDASYLSDNYDKGPIFASYVGNVFLRGPWYETSYKGGTIAVVDNIDGDSRVYQVHNYFDGTGSLYRNDAGSEITASSSPIDLTPYTIETDWRDVRSLVLVNAGARPAYRDSVDQRLIKDVICRTASARGDYPAYPTNYRALELPADPHSDNDRNGYSNIEDLMHRMADGVEGK